MHQLIDAEGEHGGAGAKNSLRSKRWRTMNSTKLQDIIREMAPDSQAAPGSTKTTTTVTTGVCSPFLISHGQTPALGAWNAGSVTTRASPTRTHRAGDENHEMSGMSHMVLAPVSVTSMGTSIPSSIPRPALLSMHEYEEERRQLQAVIIRQKTELLEEREEVEREWKGKCESLKAEIKRLRLREKVRRKRQGTKTKDKVTAMDQKAKVAGLRNIARSSCCFFTGSGGKQ